MNETLRTVMERVVDERLDVCEKYAGNLGAAVAHFERSNGSIPLTELDPAHVRAMMRDLIAAGRSPRTVNNQRMIILFLWGMAEEFDWQIPPLRRKRIPKLREPRRVPTAWRAEEFAAMLGAARKVRTRRGWGAAEWTALLLTVYDTSLRITCLLRSRLHQLDVNRRILRVPGDIQKGRCETVQSLHPDTCHALLCVHRKLGDDRLFPYPWHPRDIWRRMEAHILRPAGLPCGPRDKFHRIRRTSYSHVAAKLGIKAASEHAAHKSDLSAAYLDPSFIDRPNPLDALPRPE